MNIKQAKNVARRWVAEDASIAPGFAGAYFAGSAMWLPDDALAPATSDVDVWVVSSDPVPDARRGKFLYRELVVDVSYLREDRIPTAEEALGDYHIAGSFRTPNIIVDRTGALTRLQAAVAEGYAKRGWVRRRCDHASDNVMRYVRSVDESAPLHDQVAPWLFATGVLTHVLLVAGLRNPTVRRRYVAVRELLREYGRLEMYEPLLAMLGCADMPRDRVERHLAAMADAFDATGAVLKTPVVFAGDLAPAARRIAIDGSRELIERGMHREAVFWIAVTYSRCQKVLAADASEEVRERFDAGYGDLLGDLGVSTPAELRGRTDEVTRFLPRVRELADEIMAANRGIRRSVNASK